MFGHIDLAELCIYVGILLSVYFYNSGVCIGLGDGGLKNLH